MVSYTLSNAEDLSQENPLSFDIPTRVERGSLKEGDTTKLIFDGAERMWVDIVEVTEAGYIGLLANIPTIIKTIEWGDEVEFGPEHIIDIADNCTPRFETEDPENLRIVPHAGNVIKPGVFH